MYNFYGANCHKIGKSINTVNILLSFMTGYIQKSEIKLLRNRHLAEIIMFKMLAQYRVVSNSEFVICDINFIKLTLMHVENLFDVYINNNYIRNLYNFNMKCEGCGYRTKTEELFNSHIAKCKFCNHLDQENNSYI